MTDVQYARGSEWRKWDFAVVPPTGGAKESAAFAEAINSSVADVVAVCQPYSTSGYAALLKTAKLTKPAFPVIALKSFVNHKGKGFPFRILLDNDAELLPRIEQILSGLACLTSDGQRAELRDLDAQTRATGEIFVDFLEVIDRLNKDIKLHDKFLIILPYAGRNIAPAEDNIFQEGLIDHIDLIDSASAEDQDFFQWKSAKHAPEVIRLWLKRRKLPCIAGSGKDLSAPDFGRLTSADKSLVERYCWVKADPTFDGLRQVLADPDRVFFGKEPVILHRTKTHGNHFIRSLALNKTTDSAVKEKWFDGLRIEFGSELTAIIGNKGSGKSALVDILALLGNSQVGSFSFLTKDKFRKKNLAGNFSASLQWQDASTSDSKTLDTDPDPEQPETIKYIPQNHFERLCSLGGEEFEDELQNVIFRHLQPAKRLGCHSFRELIAKKRTLADANIAELQASLVVTNREIIALEEKSTEVYRNKISHLLKKKQQELETHEAKKPKVVKNPSSSKEIQQHFQDITQTIDSLRKDLQNAEEQILQQKMKRTLFEEQHAQLQAFVAKWQRVEQGIEDWKTQDKDLLKKEFSLNIDSLVSFGFKPESVKKKITALQKDLAALAEALSEDIAEQEKLSPDTNLPLRCQRLQEKIDAQIALLDEPHQQYQTYLSDLKAWEEHKAAIIGDTKTEGTIDFYQGILDYLDKKLAKELQAKYAERQQTMLAILQQKHDIIALFGELKAPVSAFLQHHADLIRDYDISLDVSMRMEGLESTFAAQIEVDTSGTFSGNPLEAITKIVTEYDPQSQKDVTAMLDKIIDALQFDRRQKKAVKKSIHQQIKKGKVLPLYNYLFGLEYLVPEYDLRLDNKSLSELSPGERGSLLLVFYLMIDKDETPLILDQPEDNLDNQSISKILVPFLRRAKGRRQVIMVTHNPNLAVLADAEQIIRVRIHKDKDHHVEVVSGALENPVMNRHVLDVLEGTEQAFSMRGRKYKFSGK